MITRKLNCFNLPWPVDWPALFGVARPLLVEIGFGNGDFLLHLATTRPECSIIGLEISNQSLEKAEARIARHALANAVAIHSRAETALHHLLEPQSVQEFHINNPDPWFKNRHSGRRLIQPDTVAALVSRLVPGGLLYLATDVPAYAEMSHEVLSSTPGLTNTLPAPWVDALPGRIVTKYEARGLRQGNPPKMFCYRRNDQPAPAIPVLKEQDMPHLLLKTPMTPAEILERFTRMTCHDGPETHIIFMQGYLSQGGRGLLFETTLREPTIEQHIGLMLFPRDEPGEYTLRYAAMGMPRITAGLHTATRCLGDWIVSLHPEAAITASRLRT
ncbi:MAG: tRNA (guanosine(46)-N7)-methyltransferase TrmB [Anaerolineae bacterium]|nr:tRNA (guanosine(46)-N7)-methyltransferase TrmB [Anaerolineae bacterium]